MNIDRNPDSHILIPIVSIFYDKNPMLDDLINYSPDIYSLVYSPIVFEWLSNDFNKYQMTPDELFVFVYKSQPFNFQAPRDPSIIPLHMRKMLFDAKYNLDVFMKLYNEQKK